MTRALPASGAIVAAFLIAATVRSAEPTAHTIYVVSNGWHSNVVFERRHVPAGLIPETADFPDAEYLEFGWGDAEYYPAKKTTLGMTLRAAFKPTPAVVHMAGSFSEPARRHPTAEVVALRVSETGLAQLIEYIHASFERAGRRKAEIKADGLSANSLFYPAVGRFHLGNTCNMWTARALSAAGLEVDSTAATRAEELMRQLRPLAEAP